MNDNVKGETVMEKWFGIGSIVFAMIFGGGPASAQKGVAQLEPTQPGSNVRGEVTFIEQADGMTVLAEVFNAPPGLHGIHIHEFGTCGDNGKQAGSHFDPVKSPHGFLPHDGTQKAHAGDFGNIEIAPDGTGRLEIQVPKLRLYHDTYGIAGRAVILHEGRDTFEQPDGKAGKRIACGPIRLAAE